MNETFEDRFSDPALDAEQDRLRGQLDFSEANSYTPKPGDRIYTIDVRYLDNGQAQVGVDIVLYPDEVLPAEIVYVPATGNPYVPGYFSFYEGPVVLAALQKLAEKYAAPDLVIVDGHGLAHRRKFGLACYIGAKTGLPTIGIAKKSLLPFSRNVLGNERFASHAFVLDNETVGVAIRLQEGINPVFVSAGNRISLEAAIDVIKGFTQKYRLPENLRRADAASRHEDEK
jgi:deoxyribonuclease V